MGEETARDLAIHFGTLENLISSARQDLTQEITLEFPGGNLYLSENEKGEIVLRGGAECVFKGDME